MRKIMEHFLMLVKHQANGAAWRLAGRALLAVCLLLLLRLWLRALPDSLPVASRRKLVSKIVTFPSALDFLSPRDSQS